MAPICTDSSRVLTAFGCAIGLLACARTTTTQPQIGPGGPPPQAAPYASPYPPPLPYGPPPAPQQPPPQAALPLPPAQPAPSPQPVYSAPTYPVIAARPLLGPLIGPAAWQAEARSVAKELVASLSPQNQSRVASIPLVFDPNPNEVNAFAGCDEGGAPFVAATEGLLEAIDAISQTKASDELYGTQSYEAYVAAVAPRLVSKDGGSALLPAGAVPPQYWIDARRILAGARNLRRDRRVHVRARTLASLLGAYRMRQRPGRRLRADDRAARASRVFGSASGQSTQRGRRRPERLHQHARCRAGARPRRVSVDGTRSAGAPRFLRAFGSGFRRESVARILAYPPESGVAHPARSSHRHNLAPAARWLRTGPARVSSYGR